MNIHTSDTPTQPLKSIELTWDQFAAGDDDVALGVERDALAAGVHIIALLLVALLDVFLRRPGPKLPLDRLGRPFAQAVRLAQLESELFVLVDRDRGAKPMTGTRPAFLLQ